MMQQVASLKPESAALALPLEMSNGKSSNKEARQSFDKVFQQESNQTSDDAKAHQKAEDTTSKQSPRSTNEGQMDSHDKDKQNTKASSEAAKSDDLSNHPRSEKPDTGDEKVISDAKESSTVFNETAGDYEDSVSEANALFSEDTQELPQPQTEFDTEIELETLNPKGFDYISFVSQLAELTGNGKYINTKEAPVDAINLEAVNGLNVPLTSTDKLSNDIQNISVSGQYDKQGAENIDLLQTGINKEQLQVILDAQNAQIDLNTELNDQDLQKLQTIIADMLNQLDQSGETLDHAQSEQVKLADQALLASLLLNPARTQRLELKQDQLSQLKASTDGKLTQVDDVLLKSEQALKLGSVAASTPDVLNPNDQLVKIPEVDLKVSDKDVWRKTPDLLDVKPLPENNVKPEMVKSPIDNIVALNDEQIKLAATNLNERLQTLVSDLKTQGKGNDFVAALQSGVSEYKQQLSQGREPGLNLKDLVAEALASADIDTDKSVQPKIDTAVNQFNAVLNLANAVNYSANQQQAQILGITDSQFTKEINHQQIEGTKLANAVNNQANNDKAINIFKAEGQVQLAEKVRWMVNSRNPSAEIRLDPPDLGGVNIKVNLSGDTAQVNFTVQSMGAKEALEQAAPRLRDMLQQQGIELGQTSVKQDSQGDKNAEQQSEFADSKHSNDKAENNSKDEQAEAVQDFAQGVIEQGISGGSLGGIDYYA